MTVAYGESPAMLREEGFRALESRDFCNAVKLFSELAQVSPTAGNWAYLAIAESGAGDFGSSIKNYQRSIKLGDDSVLTRFGLATSYLQIGQPIAAVQQLRLALAHDPAYLPARYAMGLALLRTDRPREAVPYLESVRKASYGKSQYWLALVQAQFAVGNAREAIRDTTEASAALPADPELATALAQICSRHEQFDTARNLYETAFELQPGNSKVALMLARVCLRTGDPGEARDLLKTLPANTGSPGEVKILTSEASALTGNIAGAKSNLTLALAAAPGNPACLIVSAWLDQLEGHYRRALAILTGIHHAGAAEPDILYQEAVSYYFLGQNGLASSECAMMQRLSPRDSRAYFLLGLVRLSQGQLSAAQGALKKAVALKPGESTYCRELGVALCRSERFRECEAELNDALALDPHSADGYYWRGRAQVHIGESRKAIDSLRTAIALNPRLAVAYAELASLYSAEGDTQQAREILNQEKKLARSTPAAGVGSLLLGEPGAVIR
ncbi:MAG TPA: tetratricopeptide repeat protein [Terriglobia bacterium]|nr:tetratricopeptide repeat protein [Terriglobia bacterium]